MDIQWDNFSKDAYEDIKSIVKDPNYLPETGKDFLQNLHKASIRMGAYDSSCYRVSRRRGVYGSDLLFDRYIFGRGAGV